MRNRLHALGLVDRALRLASDAELEALIAGLNDDQAEALERLAGHDHDHDHDGDHDHGGGDAHGSGDGAIDVDGGAAATDADTAGDDDGADTEAAAGAESDGDTTAATSSRVAHVSVDDVRATAGHGRLNGQLESVAILLSDAALADCIEQLGDNSDNPTAEQLRDALPGVIERHGLAATRLMLASTVAGEANAAATIRDLLKTDELVKFPKEAPRRIVPALERTEAKPDPDREALKARRAEIKQMKRDAAKARRLQSARDRGRA